MLEITLFDLNDIGQPFIGLSISPLPKLVIGSSKSWIRSKEISLSGHTHDDRYFTESEMNTKLNGKANTSHTHTVSQITDYSSNPPAASNIWPFQIKWSKLKTFSKSYGTVNSDIEENLGITNALNYDAIAISINSITGVLESTNYANATGIKLGVKLSDEFIVALLQDAASGDTGWNMSNSLIEPLRCVIIKSGNYKYRCLDYSDPKDGIVYTYYRLSSWFGHTDVGSVEDTGFIYSPTFYVDQLDIDNNRINLTFVLERYLRNSASSLTNFSVSLDIYGGIYQ